MNLTEITGIIQLIIAPVVMVSACSIMVGGLLTRYAAINDRLRLMTRERLDIVFSEKSAVTSALAMERLEEIDIQCPQLLKRHKIVHDSVLAVYCAIGVFLVDMFVIALGVANFTPLIAAAVLIVFLIGIAVTLFAVIMTALEVQTSHHAVHFEVQRVLHLTLPDQPPVTRSIGR